MAQKAIWISFDLGVRGDYEGIYEFLDENDARECGDSVAFLNYSFTDDLVEELGEDLKQFIEPDKRTRIYVMWQDPSKKKMKGRFVFGRRKKPRWSGYGGSDDPDDHDYDQ